MKKRILITLLVATMLLSLLAGCGSAKSDVLTAEQAQAIALEQAGLTSADAASVHTHIVDQNGIPCFSVHISAGDKEFSYVISATDGTVLDSADEIVH